MNALLMTLLASVVGMPPSDGPIRLHPANPHYLEFRGKPTILVGSGEHYGGVLNLDFDFKTYFDTLQRVGLNQTRTFSGSYREVPESFNIQNNTLAPKPNRYQAPWVKVADAANGRPEAYDLDRFDPAYFERLRAFVHTADKHGVIVEFVLFCPLYEDVLWDVNPMNTRNNRNNVGDCPREEVYTLKHPKLLEKQLAFVREVVTRLNAFDNLYFEICNEPYFGGVTLEWQARIAEEIAATERTLPKKHLIAQNVANAKAIVDKPVHPEVDIINFHYAQPVAALDNYQLNLALGDDETGFAGLEDRTYRTEAWLFLLSGGSVFSHLDYSFTCEHPDGTAKVQAPTPGGGSPALRAQLAFLKRFLEEFDFLSFKPDPKLVADGLPQETQSAALANPGRAYAVYLSGAQPDTLRLHLPRGQYHYTWYDPRHGTTLAEGSVEQPENRNDPVSLTIPKHEQDLALRVQASAP